MKRDDKPFRDGSPRPYRGRRVIARYLEPEDEDYRGNPLLEALPGEWDESKVIEKLTCYLPGNKDLRLKNNAIRKKRLIAFKTKFFQPFDCHRYMEENISMMLRNGYIGRNPLNPRFRRNLRDSVDMLIDESEDEMPPILPAGNLGFALLGSPGMGKTISLAKILIRQYPQVIQHRNHPTDPTFQDIQVVWLFLTCPHDSSTRGLCLQFFGELDAILGTTYYDDYAGENENGLIAAMATVAALHSLGGLVVDELQFLSPGKSGGKSELLKFIVQLQNTIGIPVIFVGTHAAAGIVAGGPHQARRSVGIGGDTWDPLAPDSAEWDLFLTAMWEHQVLKNYVPLDSDFAKLMHWESQGVPCYAVDLFFFAQRVAMDDGTETITLDGIRRAAENRMKFNRPYILALRSEGPVAARLLEDVVSAKYEDFKQFAILQLLLPSKDFDARQEVKSNGKVVRSGGNTPPSIGNSAQHEHQTPACGSIPGFNPPGPAKSITGSIRPRPSVAKRGKKAIYPAGTLMAIWAEGRENGASSPCEALEAVDIVRSAAEFLPALPAT